MRRQGQRASPSSSVGGSLGRLSDQEMLQRIREGNRARAQETKEEMTERELKKKEEQEQLVTTMQYVINFIIFLVFLSIPLSEPEVDWIQVVIHTVVNVAWNLLFHRNTSLYVACLVLINFATALHGHHIAQIPFLYTFIFVAGNTAFGAPMYYFWIRKAATLSDTESRKDIATLIAFFLNVAVLLATGILTPTHVWESMRTLWNLVRRLSLG